LKNCTNSY